MMKFMPLPKRSLFTEQQKHWYEYVKILIFFSSFIFGYFPQCFEYVQRHHQELLYLFQTLLNKSPPWYFLHVGILSIFSSVTRQTFIDISRTGFHMSLLVIYTISTGQIQNIFLINLKEYPKFYNHLSMKRTTFQYKPIYTEAYIHTNYQVAVWAQGWVIRMFIFWLWQSPQGWFVRGMNSW